MSKNLRIFVYAIATLSGSIIGVGLFALPFITLKVGIWVMLGYFFILGPLVIIIHLLFSEVALETPDFLRLPSYAKIYLGKWGEKLALISSISGFLGVILAYLIIGGRFLTYLLSPIFGGGDILYSILYFIVGALLIYIGIKAIAKIEFFAVVLFSLVLIAIFYHGFPIIRIENLFIPIKWQVGLLFLPFGPILFSLWGVELIPEIEEILGREKSALRKLIPVAIFIPIIIYVFFILLVLGISGGLTSEDAITGLKNFLPQNILILAFIFVLLTTFSSFLTLGLTLRNIFWYDLKLPKNIAWLIVFLVPLFLFFIGLRNFTEVISLVGAVMLSTNGILIIRMYQVCKKVPRFSLLYFLTSFLILIFILGILYGTLFFLNGKLI